MAFVVYRPEEILEFKSAINKYVCIQGKIYCVSEKLSLEDGNKESLRREKLPRDHADLRNYYLIKGDDCVYLCCRQYFNGL